MIDLIPKLVRWLCATMAPLAINEREQFKDAMHFARTIQPLTDTDYNWIFAYAEDRYRQLAVTYKDLDDKANEIIKYLGGGAGILSVAMALKIDAKNLDIAVATIPAVLCALIAIWIAIVARQPNPAHLPPTVKDTFGYANSYGNEKDAKAAFVGQLHVACVSATIANGIKAERVRLAIWALFISVVLLLVPLMLAIKKVYS